MWQCLNLKQIPLFINIECNLKVMVLNIYFSFAGKHCEKQDHCASQPCRNGAECISVGDSYKCTCAPGFTGMSCMEDLDECKQKPCRHGKCFNTHGSYT